MLRSWIFASALLVLAMATSAARAEDAIVRVGHGRLTPPEITVKVGSTVTFLNEDEMPGGHSVVADDGSFESPPLAKDESWSHTFEKPGRVGYAIKQHPAAKGTVIVE